MVNTCIPQRIPVTEAKTSDVQNLEPADQTLVGG